MKAVMIMFDTLCRRFLSPYGNHWIKTPNFERLAKHSCTFDNSYVGSMPCMPARRDLLTGRYNFLHRSWGPIEPYDECFTEIMKKSGMFSHLISDHQHYWEDGGCTYHTRYSSWEINRGQEGDTWKCHVKDPEVPEHIGRLWRQDLINRNYLDKEEKQPQTLNFQLGLEFLKTNKNEDNWYLQIENFDPHEPYFTHEQFKNLYPHDYDGPLFDWPEYKQLENETEEQIEHIRFEYASLVSMCDKNLGEILDFFDQHDMWKDTMLIVNTDHGFLLGEHDCWAKCVHPFYQEVAHTPFFIWDPRSKIKNQRRKALIQGIDIAPTLLNLFNLKTPKQMLGKDLFEAIKNDTPTRDYALFGLHGGQVNITDGNYVYMRGYNKDNSPLNNYTLMPTHMREMFSCQELQGIELSQPFNFTKNIKLLKIKSGFDGKGDCNLRNCKGHKLYDVTNGNNVMIENSEIEERMKIQLIKIMKENDAPIEQYERLDLKL